MTVLTNCLDEIRGKKLLQKSQLQCYIMDYCDSKGTGVEDTLSCGKFTSHTHLLKKDNLILHDLYCVHTKL